MKPSHFTTPRTLAECHFSVGYSSGKSDTPKWWAELVSGIAIFAVVLFILIAVPVVFQLEGGAPTPQTQQITSKT